MSEAQLTDERTRAHERAAIQQPAGNAAAARSSLALLFVAWAAIATPLAWGIWITLSKSLALFR
jgi:hypothetical protein